MDRCCRHDSAKSLAILFERSTLDEDLWKEFPEATEMRSLRASIEKQQNDASETRCLVCATQKFAKLKLKHLERPSPDLLDDAERS